MGNEIIKTDKIESTIDSINHDDLSQYTFEDLRTKLELILAELNNDKNNVIIQTFKNRENDIKAELFKNSNDSKDLIVKNKKELDEFRERVLKMPLISNDRRKSLTAGSIIRKDSLQDLMANKQMENKEENKKDSSKKLLISSKMTLTKLYFIVTRCMKLDIYSLFHSIYKTVIEIMMKFLSDLDFYEVLFQESFEDMITMLITNEKNLESSILVKLFIFLKSVFKNIESNDSLKILSMDYFQKITLIPKKFSDPVFLKSTYLKLCLIDSIGLILKIIKSMFENYNRTTNRRIYDEKKSECEIIKEHYMNANSGLRNSLRKSSRGLNKNNPLSNEKDLELFKLLIERETDELNEFEKQESLKLRQQELTRKVISEFNSNRIFYYLIEELRNNSADYSCKKIISILGELIKIDYILENSILTWDKDIVQIVNLLDRPVVYEDANEFDVDKIATFEYEKENNNIISKSPVENRKILISEIFQFLLNFYRKSYEFNINLNFKSFLYGNDLLEKLSHNQIVLTNIYHRIENKSKENINVQNEIPKKLDEKYFYFFREYPDQISNHISLNRTSSVRLSISLIFVIVGLNTTVYKNMLDKGFINPTTDYLYLYVKNLYVNFYNQDFTNTSTENILNVKNNLKDKLYDIVESFYFICEHRNIIRVLNVDFFTNYFKVIVLLYCFDFLHTEFYQKITKVFSSFLLYNKNKMTILYDKKYNFILKKIQSKLFSLGFKFYDTLKSIYDGLTYKNQLENKLNEEEYNQNYLDMFQYDLNLYTNIIDNCKMKFRNILENKIKDFGDLINILLNLLLNLNESFEKDFEYIFPKKISHILCEVDSLFKDEELIHKVLSFYDTTFNSKELEIIEKKKKTYNEYLFPLNCFVLIKDPLKRMKGHYMKPISDVEDWYYDETGTIVYYRDAILYFQDNPDFIHKIYFCLYRFLCLMEYEQLLKKIDFHHDADNDFPNKISFNFMKILGNSKRSAALIDNRNSSIKKSGILPLKFEKLNINVLQLLIEDINLLVFSNGTDIFTRREALRVLIQTFKININKEVLWLKFHNSRKFHFDDSLMNELNLNYSTLGNTMFHKIFCRPEKYTTMKKVENDHDHKLGRILFTPYKKVNSYEDKFGVIFYSSQVLYLKNKLTLNEEFSISFKFYNPIINTGKFHTLLCTETGESLLCVTPNRNSIGVFDRDGKWIDSGIELDAYEENWRTFTMTYKEYNEEEKKKSTLTFFFDGLKVTSNDDVFLKSNLDIKFIGNCKDLSEPFGIFCDLRVCRKELTEYYVDQIHKDRDLNSLWVTREFFSYKTLNNLLTSYVELYDESEESFYFIIKFFNSLLINPEYRKNKIIEKEELNESGENLLQDRQEFLNEENILDNVMMTSFHSKSVLSKIFKFFNFPSEEIKYQVSKFLKSIN